MKSKEALQEFYYCDTDNVVEKSKILYELLEKDLDRLEKLEKAIKLLKARVKMLETHHKPKSRCYYLYIGGRIVFLSREEYDLLKEVLENAL